VGAYIIRRLLLIPITLFILVAFFFFMLRTIPGDFVDFLYQEEGTTARTIKVDVNEEGDVVDAYAELIRKRYGLSDPIHVQFVRWLSHVGRGDFGFSYLHQKSSWQVFRDRAPATLELGSLGLILAISLGIPLGIISARFADTPVDNGIRFISLVGLSTPSFVSAAVIIVVLSLFFYYVPPDYVPLTKDPIGNFQNMIFPVLVIGYSASAPLMRLTRSQMLEVLGQDYIRTARAKGLQERVVFFKHGLRNALLPVITTIGFSLNTLIAGSVITEVVFGINGMGAALVRAAQERDFPVLQLFVVIFGLATMGMNLIIDILYAVVDPRVRYS
jgi:peptide/nickel transport system permease protein